MGEVVAPAQRFENASVEVDGELVPLASQRLLDAYPRQGDELDENAEWVVRVTWLATIPEKDAYWVKGMFASPHSACKLRQEFILDRLAEHFGVHDDQ